jgi:IclR family transcriptional regulator, KDG regulon repressor
MKAVNSADVGQVQSVTLALDILECLAGGQDSMGVAEIAATLGTTKSRVYRHLRTLLNRGYIHQSGAFEKYQIGGRLVSLSLAVSENFCLANVGKPAISRLRDTLGHFTVLSEPEIEGMRVVATRSGKSMVEVQVKQGSLLAFHSTAQGKLGLAFGDGAILERACRAKLEQTTPFTITNPKALRAEIDLVRRRGYATAYNEALVGSNTLAAPILATDGALLGTIAIIDSIQFIPEAPGRNQIARVTAAAKQIARSFDGAGEKRSRASANAAMN